jgi:hypothetical protein
VRRGIPAVLAALFFTAATPSWGQSRIPEPPSPNEPWKTTVIANGTPASVTFDIGETIGQDSTFFRVYRLKSKAGIPPGLLSEKLGNDLVIKVLKRGSEELAQLERDIPGITENSVGRMLKAQQHLEGRIEHLRIEGFDDPGIVIQERFKKQPGVFETFSLKKTETRNDVVTERPLTASEKRALLGAEKRRAILELCKALLDANLGWLDFHLGNIYLKRVGGRWVAGILDQDFIGPLDELKQGVYARFGDTRLTASRSPSQSMATIKDLTMLYAKVFEALGWVEYDAREQRLKAGVFEPEEIRRVIPDFPFLTAPARPAM